MILQQPGIMCHRCGEVDIVSEGAEAGAIRFLRVAAAFLAQKDSFGKE
jgi:hypothetical protein